LALNRLIGRFIDRGAVSRGVAMTLDQLGITRKTPAFGLLRLHGYIEKTDDDRYFFDAEQWESNPLHKFRQAVADHMAGLEDEDDGLGYDGAPPTN